MAYQFSLPTDLQLISLKLANELQAGASGKVTRIIGFQVTLLEIFDHEIKKNSKLGYCDFELAFICFDVTVALYHMNKSLTAVRTEALIQSVKELIDKKTFDFDSIKGYLEEHANNDVASTIPKISEDLLLQRFQNLTADKVSSKVEQVPTMAESSSIQSILETFKYNECITSKQLHDILANSQFTGRVLLIDYRTRKEFDYNHINFVDLVQIDPSWVNGLEMGSGDKELTDQDLEQRLQMLMPEDQFKKFQKRSQYELVVIYNLKYGPTEWLTAQNKNKKFEILQNLLLDGVVSGVPSSSPFTKLIDFITFRNKYLSSRLKRHPVYLGGGISNWFEEFGATSITKSSIGINGGNGSQNGNSDVVALSRPEASMSRNGLYSSPSINSHSSRRSSYNGGTGQMNGNLLDLTRSSSPYLKNFSDYISTATSTGTPLSMPLTSSVLDSESATPYYGANLKYETPKYYGNVSSQSSVGIINNERRTSNSLSKLIPSTPVLSSTTPSQYKPSSVPSTSVNSPKFKDSSPVPSPKPTVLSQPSISPIKFLEQYATGLTNLGNSCYMNCVLQCLGATPQLTSFFFPTLLNAPKDPSSDSSAIQTSYRRHINVNNKLGSKGILTTNFVTLLTNMFSNNGKFFTPMNFKKVIGSLSPGGQFASFDQQDCLEFLNFILDGLHEDLNQMAIKDPKEKKAIMELTTEQEKTREFLPVRLASTIEWERYLKLNFSVIVDYFQGQYLSQLRCLECGLTSTTYNAFQILSLPIPEKLGSNTTITLDDCLKEFVNTELLDNNNKWHCPRCKKFTKLTKKISITRLPQVLIIHFKRFKVSPHTGYMDKMNNMINYPVNDILDLTSYWPEVGTTMLNQDPSHLMPKEKEQQILSTLPTRNQKPPFRYKLYGVVNHFGTLSTGHYTSYVYKESDAKNKRGWCYFDDAKITYNCKESQVLTPSAYCLFYERI